MPGLPAKANVRITLIDKRNFNLSNLAVSVHRRFAVTSPPH